MVFNRDGAEVARAEAEFDRAQADRSGVVVALEGTLAAAQIEAEDALAAAAASRPALAAANEARIARIGYAEGKFSQLDLLEAERSLTQTREAAIDSLAALHEAKVRLAHLQGDTAPYTRI
jgi:cobalt-zinc-cadmium efflux system outer membrane protein